MERAEFETLILDDSEDDTMKDLEGKSGNASYFTTLNTEERPPSDLRRLLRASFLGNTMEIEEVQEQPTEKKQCKCKINWKKAKRYTLEFIYFGMVMAGWASYWGGDFKVKNLMQP